MPLLQCVIVTPEKTVLDEAIDFLVVPLYDGELGIASGHSPMIGRLGNGELRIRSDNETSRYYVEGGFVQVAGNVVSVLTQRVVPAVAVDVAAAEELLRSAQSKPAHTPEQMDLRDRHVDQARAQMRVVRRLAKP